MEPKPKSLSEVDFFTRQVLDPDGFAFMWVYKPYCPKCKKARMTKIKKRDKLYTCPACKYTLEKPDYNALLIANVEYTCPFCGKKGEFSGNFKKPEKKSATVMLKFECEHCGKKIKIVRLKKKKKKK